MEIVASADLKVGMFVVEPDCSWTALPFALQGFIITEPRQIDVFQQKCRFVHIDRSRSLGEHYQAAVHKKDDPLKARPFNGPGSGEEDKQKRLLTPDEIRRRDRRRRFLDFLHSQRDTEEGRALSSELERIEPRYDELNRALERSFDAVAQDKQMDLDGVREGVRDLSGSLQRNPDALMWLLRLKRQDEYSFDHSMDVSVYMLLLGTHIGWRGHRLLELGLAGLLQDLGKVHLPNGLLNKQTSLTAAERALVESHVASTLEILYAQRGLPPEVMVIVSRHHERWDGSGYPRRLRLDQIGLGGEMAGLCDSFCAMLKKKPYRDALSHQEALEELYQLRDKKFNPVLMEQFVQCVGLYPIGTLVELSNGEVGVVIQQNRVQRSRPRILIMLDAEKNQVKGYRVLDLREEQNQSLRVLRALPLDAYGLSDNDYYVG